MLENGPGVPQAAGWQRKILLPAKYKMSAPLAATVVNRTSHSRRGGPAAVGQHQAATALALSLAGLAALRQPEVAGLFRKVNIRGARRDGWVAGQTC